jgi:hypothetical protein
MRPRWHWVLVCLAVLLAAGVAVCSLASWQDSSDAITEAGFQQIRPGMRRAEVEAILGGPSGDYTGGCFRPETQYFSTHGESALVWVGRQAAICVWVADGQVINCSLGKVVPVQDPPATGHRGLLPW